MEKNETDPQPIKLNAFGDKIDESFLSKTEKEALSDPLVAEISDAVGRRVDEETDKLLSGEYSDSSEMFEFQDTIVIRPGILVKMIVDHLREQGKLKE
jgi:hypothetical protein